MFETLGQKYKRQAQDSIVSTRILYRKLALQLVEQAKEGLDLFSEEAGLDFLYLPIHRNKEFPVAYEHRDEIVEMCMKELPVDIRCTLEASDPLTSVFVLEFRVVKPYDGGEVNYDFPVFSFEDTGYVNHNLDHLLALQMGEVDVVQVKAFAIILGMQLGCGRMGRALEWGLENPQVILDLIDRDGFFAQFGDGEIEVEKFVGAAR